MFGTATKYFAGLTFLLIGAATVFGIGTAANGNGDVAFYGTVVLGTMGVATGFLTWLSLEAGDGASADRDREAYYEPTPTYWPIMSAAGITFLIVGLVINTQLAIFGLLVVIVAAIEWTLSAWSDKRSLDADANYAARTTIARPFEVPLFGALAIAVPVYLISSVFTSLSKNGASWTALGVATVVLVAAFTFNAKPDIRRPVVAGLIGLSGVVIVGAGIAGISDGVRDVHKFDEDDHSDEDHSDDEAAPGAVVVIR